VTRTHHKRALPSSAIAFASPEGRQLFAEALATGGMVGYFPLAEQFHTQSDPAYCGLGSLVTALNALGIDPERVWKGGWRWFAEDMLDCCLPLAEIRERGLSIDQFACLARCNGAEVDLERAETTNLSAWRDALQSSARGNVVLVASYDRAAVGQTGSGHFSPIGGYHASRDLALILDVARFKYPPHWVSAERLWQAMQSIDPVTGQARGWIALRRSDRANALGPTAACRRRAAA
jgi:glutathione gamma-glutamylcysteinyltransferase